MRLIILIWTIIAAFPVSVAQRSPFNELEVTDPGPDGTYRMIISGHLHGASNDRSGYPAGTLLANIDQINALDADIFLSTGDLFLDPQKDHERYQHTLFRTLNVPLFNAPGNHDNTGYYTENFGDTFRSFPMGNDRIVLLDTERKDGSIDDDQLKLLEELTEGPSPGRIFIISHRPIWAEGHARYGPLFEGNTRGILGTNYDRDVYPVLERLAQRSQVFWISGSMAGAARSSIFFQPDAPNITFIQSAIRNETRDALLIADVGPGSIRWSAFSLSREEVLAPEEYNADWWWAQRGKKESFNWRLLPYLIKITVTHHAFWYGAGAGVLLILIVGRIMRRGL